ncbi:MAG TPA: aldose epimerase family protein [Steroidobacteraceae bacterium]|jgi:aldose 1-epimerase
MQCYRSASCRPAALAFLAIAALSFNGCSKPTNNDATQTAGQPMDQTTAQPTAAARASVTHKTFGTLPDGTNVELFTLTNQSGASVQITNYGGIVTAIRVPDRNGKLDDVVLGYDSLAGYVKNPTYFGALIGRYANRIGKAQFTLDGKTYKLAANNDGNTLHGGLKGFDKAVWQADPFEKLGATGVTLTYTSPDGEEGFPGTLTTHATYTFTDSNELSIQYTATTDRPTVLNLTNHSYFNLAGEGSGDVLDHLLTINAQRYTPVDATLIPLGKLADVANTPLDFRSSTAIGARIDADDPQLKLGVGYDHNFVVTHQAGSSPGSDLALAARVEDPKTGRVLEVRTTEPGVQLYTANHLDGSVVGKAGHAYGKRNAFCLETQHYPDSPNQPSFPTTVLRPGEEFHSQTVYAFGVK